VADDEEDAGTRESKRDRAVERKAQNEARRPLRGRGTGHWFVIGVASASLKLSLWIKRRVICAC
jgi:hypothetical protein